MVEAFAKVILGPVQNLLGLQSQPELWGAAEEVCQAQTSPPCLGASPNPSTLTGTRALAPLKGCPTKFAGQAGGYTSQGRGENGWEPVLGYALRHPMTNFLRKIKVYIS